MIMNYPGLERPDSRIARGAQLTGQRLLASDFNECRDRSL